ncbi:MAG: PEP-CTERM system histidine kinase PrsK [Nitrospira sp.]|nr:PEP-CTERM system histidine kinase PrsK [Nitrospira sp.]
MTDIIAMLAASTCLVLALTVVVKGWVSRFHRSVAGVLLGAAGVCVGEWLVSVPQAVSGLGFILCFLSELLLVVMLFQAVTAFNREPEEAVNRTRWIQYVSTTVSVGLGMWIVLALLDADASKDRIGDGVGLSGDITYLFLVIMYVMSIAYIEGLLRTLRDPVLYQLKFVLIGLVALAGFRIFALSQTVFPQRERLDVVTHGLAILMVVALMAYGFMRARFQSFTERIYISPKVLSGSLTFLVVGLYVFGVGAVSQMARSAGVSFGIALSVLFVLVALVALAILMLSRSTRTALRSTVARNFYRSKYDYRAQWLEVTEVFRERDSVDAIWDGLLGLLSRTFSAGRISVWYKIEAEGRFHQVRSTNTEPPPEPLEASHRLILALAETDRPLAVDLVGLLPQDSFVRATRTVLCVPLRMESELIGLIALSGDVTGVPYGQDDHDLLRAMAHHVGVLLAHARLAEDRRGSAELEALHRFSAFCLHDLKNLAARLSLVAQNADLHGQDPAFQESAMKTVSDTAKKMTALMSKLSLKAFQSPDTVKPEVVDLRSMIEDTVGSLRGRGPRWRMTMESVPPLMVVREGLHQVLLNILLNAKQAVGEEGEVRIALRQLNRAVVLTVEDTGCGIPLERLRTLFRPVQSSRPGGLGIGLYHCRRIVEGYGGMIQIRSVVEQGTTVRIELPFPPLSVVQPSDAREQSVVSS